MTTSGLRSFSFVTLMLSLLIGCGSENPLSRQRVTGTVTLNKEPVANGTIRFEPAGPQGVASGTTISQGKFDIPAERGLPTGEYIVRISAAGEGVAAEAAPGDSSKLAEELIPAAYNSNSQLKITVNAGANQPHVFDLTK